MYDIDNSLSLMYDKDNRKTTGPDGQKGEAKMYIYELENNSVVKFYVNSDGEKFRVRKRGYVISKLDDYILIRVTDRWSSNEARYNLFRQTPNGLEKLDLTRKEAREIKNRMLAQ